MITHKRASTQQAILTALAGEPRSIREIARAIQKGTNTTAKTACKLAMRGTIVRCGSGLYRLPMPGETMVAQAKMALEDLAAGVAPQAVAVAHGVSRQWAEAAAYTTLPKPATVEPLQIWRHRCHHAPAKTVLEVCDYRTYRGTVRAAKFGAHKFVPVKSLLTKERWAYEGIAAGPMKDKAPVVRPIAMHRELQRSGP